jgi:hypothetical protein
MRWGSQFGNLFARTGSNGARQERTIPPGCTFSVASFGRRRAECEVRALSHEGMPRLDFSRCAEAHA